MFALETTLERTRAAERDYATIFERVVRAQHPELSEADAERLVRNLLTLDAQGYPPFQRRSARED